MKIGSGQNLEMAQIQAITASQDSALGGAGLNPKAAKSLKEIKKLAQDFESIFSGIMLKSMRASIQKSGFMDGGNAEDIYRSMLDQEYSKSMAQTSNSSLAKNIEQYLIDAAGLKVDFAKSQNAAKGRQAYGAEGLQVSTKKAKIDSKSVNSNQKL